MIRKHKELRSKDPRTKKNSKKVHGVKRCGSDSWQADKVLKHAHLDAQERPTEGRSSERTATLEMGYSTMAAPANMAIWPPISAPSA